MLTIQKKNMKNITKKTIKFYLKIAKILNVNSQTFKHININDSSNKQTVHCYPNTYIFNRL